MALGYSFFGQTTVHLRLISDFRLLAKVIFLLGFRPEQNWTFSHWQQFSFVKSESSVYYLSNQIVIKHTLYRNKVYANHYFNSHQLGTRRVKHRIKQRKKARLLSKMCLLATELGKSSQKGLRTSDIVRDFPSFEAFFTIKQNSDATKKIALLKGAGKSYVSV